jgi:hypothetical protein
MAANETLAFLERHWASTCKLMFGSPVGGLLEFEEYLLSDVMPPSARKSSSGNDVNVLSEIPRDARIADYEALFGKETAKAGKLSINDIKDIDSLANAMGEVAVFAGNVVQGQSSHVESSNRILDSHFIYCSHDIIYSKYVAFSHTVKHSESSFGMENSVKNSFAIRGFDVYGSTVMFECLRAYTSANCYYCANVDDCRDCLFSFNLRSASRRIGNLELPSEKFSELKRKLVSEMRESLSSKKKAASVLDIVGGINEQS